MLNRKLSETNPEMIHMLGLSDNDFKAAIKIEMKENTLVTN